MAIVVNTNIQSIKVQNNLNGVTDAMNTAMERMTTGLKINSAADDAAGLVISITYCKLLKATLLLCKTTL